MGHRGWAAAALFSVVVAGCIYNSQIHEQVVSEHRRANRLTPEEVDASSAEGRGAWRASRRVRVRAWTSRDYRAEVISARAHVDALVDRANEVLVAKARVRLELVEVREWNDPIDQTHLSEVLEAFESMDAAEDVDVSIAFVGSTPLLEQSVEALGRARVLGKHVVVRAMNDAAESRAIEESFRRISADEKARLRARREAHKELTVLLHEVGHAFGALHVREAPFLMNAAYAIEMAEFAPITLDLLRLGVTLRLTSTDDAETYRGLVDQILAVYRDNEGAFVEEDRAAVLAALDNALRAGRESVGAEAPNHGEGTLWDVSMLDNDERARYRAAREAASGADDVRAWRELAPVIAARPDVYAIQELACEIGGRLGAAEARGACARMMSLATAPAAQGN